MGLEAVIGKYVHRNANTKSLNWFAFRAYDLLTDTEDTTLIQKALYELVAPVANQIDVFVPLVKSGISISNFLQIAFDKPILFPVETSIEIQKKLTSKFTNCRLCLVDTNINTRGTFIRSIAILTKNNLFPNRFISILFNDLWNQEDENLAQLRIDNRLHFLCATSELVKLDLISRPVK